ncbi:MAG: hypothetical protein IJH63_00355 [Methanobrevibacter sp.]|nr:hypothetical protein [Methanosphaera sp.]MBR0369155.1 hypothetical protein [Methanobrevibacter sp.]
MANVTRYNLAQIVFEDTEITTDSFKTTWKIETDDLTACNSYNPYGVDITSESFDWEMSDVAAHHRPFFQEMIEKQKADPTNLAMIATYDYNKYTGDIAEDDVYDGVYITELSKETANKPFSVKGGALRKL